MLAGYRTIIAAGVSLLGEILRQAGIELKDAIDQQHHDYRWGRWCHLLPDAGGKMKYAALS